MPERSGAERSSAARHVGRAWTNLYTKTHTLHTRHVAVSIDISRFIRDRVFCIGNYESKRAAMFAVAYARFDNRHSITSLSMKTRGKRDADACPAPSDSILIYLMYTRMMHRETASAVHSINPFLFDMLILVTISYDTGLHISSVAIRTTRFAIRTSSIMSPL